MNAYIVGVKYSVMQYDVDSSLEELIGLCNACDITVVNRCIQKLDKIQPSTFIGKGKVTEIKEQLEDIDMVIFDEELSPLQVKHLTDILEIEVTDRTDLILRIFESRAKTKEAMLQVSIAKNQYLLPRLAGMQEHMSHQQGGSGFRGSGEKQIELDRRVIYNQLHQAKMQLQHIVKQRQTQRKRRKENGIKVIALVGYTNSGKSTLLNALCQNKQKRVLEQDMLFATLETATRHIQIKHHNCLLTDTVGFIDRLPHHLVQAFRSTLEEVKEADVLIHVVDSASEEYQQHIETTNAVLKALDASDIPMIYAYNKVDKNKYGWLQPMDPYVFISAKDKSNLDTLEDMISRVLFKEYAVYELNIPYPDGEVYKYLQQHCTVLECQYLENVMYLKIEAHPSFIYRYQQYLLKH